MIDALTKMKLIQVKTTKAVFKNMISTVFDSTTSTDTSTRMSDRIEKLKLLYASVAPRTNGNSGITLT